MIEKLKNIYFDPDFMKTQRFADNRSFMKKKLDIDKIKELETIAKELDAEKLRLSAVSESVCDHSWMNTGMSVQGRSLMVCIKCRETKQTVC